MSGTLALSSAIASMDRESLTALVRQRRPQAAAGVTDPIGLASELLRTDAVTRALAPLQRHDLAALLTLAAAEAASAESTAVDPAHVFALTQLGLLGLNDAKPISLPEVTAVLRDGLVTAGLSVESLAANRATPDSPATVPDTSTWYASAVTVVGQASEILRALTDRPGRLNRNGSIAVATVRSLSDSTSIEASQTSLALTALERAGLVWSSRASHLLLSTAGAADWLALPYGERWLALAQSTLTAMPAPLRTALSSADSHLTHAVSELPHLFPLLPAADLAAASLFANAAEHLGLTVQGALSAPAQAILAEDLPLAQQHIDRDLPDLAAGIYVQPDLSVMVPGPLSPEDEADLAALSRPEHLGVATTRRITEASLADAIERGSSAESARTVFKRLSLTGIPQPLDYLLTNLAERVGTVVVTENISSEGRTRVTVSRPEMRQTILVDRGLQHVQFTPSASDRMVLFSRLRPEHVTAALTDARYPATTAHARTPVASKPAVAPTPDAASSASPGELSPELASLVERVFLAAHSEPGAGDFTRLIELAIRDRKFVSVTAEARGQVHTFTLMPVSLSAGRLRATDTSAGMERTLPVSFITAVELL